MTACGMALQLRCVLTDGSVPVSPLPARDSSRSAGSASDAAQASDSPPDMLLDARSL